MRIVIDANRLFSVIIGKRLNSASMNIFFSDDIEYFALALHLECSIWSDEKLLKEQSKVEVFSTVELFDILFP